MSELVFDIETDGLDATKIWCIVTYDINTEEVKTFRPDEIRTGITFLSKAKKLIGHNIIGFDIPVIKNLYGVDVGKDKIIRDTLVLSRLFNPTREGSHSLEAWGYRLEHNKIDYKEFDQYSDEMMEYCINDVKLNAMVFEALKKESKGFSKQSVELEHEVASLVNSQRDKGFLLNMEDTQLLYAHLFDQMEETKKEVTKTFKPKEEVYTLRATYNKGGALSKFAKCRELNKRLRLTSEEYDQIALDGKIKRTITTEFNLGSRKQIGEYLQDFGWKPKKFTPTGQPIVDEKILNKINNIPEAKLIAKYLMLQKRTAQIQSWLKEAQDDDRVHGYVNSNGAVTGRMTHSSPNMAQIPSLSAEYGKECRRCWTVPEGYKLVGIDASQLELRMLAHYMDDEDYINEIINGDIHTANQKLAGLKSRDQAKTFIYALIYGAANQKLGTVAGGGRELGARLRESFFNNLPSFATLATRVERSSSKGHIKGVDGRKLIIRRKHAALNTLLQSAGAIAMKQALIFFSSYIEKLKIDASVVANVHDEWQVEVVENKAETIGEIGVRAIREAAEALKLKCPLDGEYKIGENWSDTH